MTARIETKVMAAIVKPVGEPIYSEFATEVRIADESGGEYVEVQQTGRDLGKIAINPGEWPMLRRVINNMIKRCEKV